MAEKEKILVVEDNDFVRMQIVRYIADAGYDVREGTDGSQALDIIKTDKVDVAVVDVRMEPVDGFEFIKTIRGFEIKIPIILVTGDNSTDLLEKCASWDVGAVLIKPIQKDRLLAAIDRSLKNSKKRLQR